MLWKEEYTNILNLQVHNIIIVIIDAGAFENCSIYHELCTRRACKIIHEII